MSMKITKRKRGYVSYLPIDGGAFSDGDGRRCCNGGESTTAREGLSRGSEMGKLLEKNRNEK